MTKPPITIITPCLNQHQYLERTICSVLDQGYEDLQYIVVDSGSTDATADILELYEDELSWWTSPSGVGPVEAINKSIKQATGQIIGVLACDDLLLPGALEEVAARMTAQDAPSWVVGQCTRIGPADQFLGQTQASKPQSLASFLMHDSGFLPAASSFWRRDLAQTHGLFDPELKFAFNYEFGCRLMAGGLKPCMIPQTLAARREHFYRTDPAHALQAGLEHIDIAQRYADQLPLKDRYALWLNCDIRRRIYALAQAELYSSSSRRFVWQQLLKHPWWITNESIRHTLLRGVKRPLPQEIARPAA